MGKRVAYKKENVILRTQVAGLLAAQQNGQLGGNQNVGPTHYGITQSSTTDAGLAGPSGFQFGIASPDLAGYDDGNPFTTYSATATGNAPATSNQSGTGLNGAFGVAPGAPALPQNSIEASQLQLKFDMNTTVRYGIYAAAAVVGLFLVFRYLKK